MKKIPSPSITTLTIVLTLIMMYSESRAQTTASVKKNVIESNKNFIEWFNSGRIDSISSLYSDNACLDGRGCGKDFIKEYYKTETAQYKIQELVTSDITVKDNIAIERGRWKVLLPSGMFLSGGYTSEWQLQNKKWVIVKESMPTTDQ